MQYRPTCADFYDAGEPFETRHACLDLCVRSLSCSDCRPLFALPIRLYDAVDSAHPTPLRLTSKRNCTRIIYQPRSPPSLASPHRNLTPTSVSSSTLAFATRRRWRWCVIHVRAGYRSLTGSAHVRVLCARTVKQDEVTPGIPASEYERRRKQLVDGLPDGSLAVCVAGHVKYMSAGEPLPHVHAPFENPPVSLVTVSYLVSRPLPSPFLH
jgi:hypothetical protein